MNSAPSVSDLVRHGDAALGAGNPDEAIALYRSALTRDAGHPDVWYNLGWALRARRRFAEALDAYGEALRRGGDHPEHLHLNRAAILADHLFDTDAALAELRRATAISPRFVPAWLNLGTLYEDLADAEAAQAAYRQALVHDAGCGRAYARLAMIDIAHGGAGEALAGLQSPIATAADPADRAEMLFALAAAQDALACHDDAFATLLAANQLARSIQPAVYDAGAQERFVDAMIAACPAHAPEMAAPGAQNGLLHPVFIVGMFRSGSTLTEQLLARHSTIVAGGELEFIPALAHAGLQPYPASLPYLGPAELGAMRRDYLAELARVAPDGWVTDKRCDNVFHLGLINRLFPEAPIVLTRRHPLDIVLSTLFLHFGEAISYGHDQRSIAHYMIQQERLITHWRTVLGDRLVEIDYGRLVADPRGELAPVLRRTGLHWREASDQTGAGAPRVVRTASSWQVRQPVHNRSTGRWTNYARQLEPARAMLSDAGLI